MIISNDTIKQSKDKINEVKSELIVAGLMILLYNFNNSINIGIKKRKKCQ